MSVEINLSNNQNGTLKKRVLFIITQSEMGGAQRFLFNFVSNLDPNKYEIKVAMGSDGGGELLRKLVEIKIECIVLNNLKRDVSLWKDFIAVKDINNLINSFRPDSLFLLSSKAGFIGSLGSIWPKKLKSLRVIYRIGGWTFNDPWSNLIKKSWIFLEKKSSSWKDVIIVNNQNDFDQALSLHIKPKEKLVLIHNGLDPYKINFKNHEEARKFIIEKIKTTKEPKRVIGTIANLYPAKGIEFFVKSAKHFSDNEDSIFVIIGDGKDRDKLERIIRDEGLNERVFILGQVDNASEYITAFDVFVLSSIKEGFPWVLLEAMSAKVPVIATSVGAVPEIIEDGKNGFIVPPKRPDVLAMRIKEVLNNEHLRKEFSILAHQSILFKFSSDKMIKASEELL